MGLDKKYQIFISSTYTDLIEQRKKVRDAILSMYNFPVGMELFGAANEEQWEIIKETIDSSDYYVLIVGHRYGTVIDKGPDAGISYTEKEFRYALEKGIPVLVYLIDPDVSVKPGDIEKENPEKFEKFKEKVSTGRTVDWWKNSDDLAAKVTNDLYKQIARTNRPGWIKADRIDVEKSLKTITDLTEQVMKLSEENKQLLIENNNLKKQHERSPELFLRLEPDSSTDKEDDSLYARCSSVRVEDDTDAVYIKAACVGTAIIENRYATVSKSDFFGEERTHITDEDIEKYNRGLPSREIIDAYIEKFRIYHTIQDFGIPMEAVIHNIGSAKATDVSATVEFPQGILCLDIDDVRKMKEPEEPKRPRDLHEIAYERANPMAVSMRKMQSQLEVLSTPNFNYSSIIPAIGNLGRMNTVFESVDISDNVVNIETKNGIVHTKFDFFRGFYIVPLSQGEFKVKITLMCAEFSDPIKKELTIICE